MDRPIKKSLLERQVPKWYEKNKDIVLRDKGPRPIQFLQRLPKLEALEVWARGFEDENKAAVLFLEMYAENPRTAFWHANNKPNVFGKRSESSTPSEPLNSRNFRLTPKDRETVLNARDEIAACMTSPLAYPRIDIEAAWLKLKVYNLTVERKQTRQTKEREWEIER